MRFFYERFEVKNRKIINAVPTPIFLVLQSNHAVILTNPQLPRLVSVAEALDTFWERNHLSLKLLTNRLCANALPDPDFKYSSKSLASLRVVNAQYHTSLQGICGFVDDDNPLLCIFSLSLKSELCP